MWYGERGAGAHPLVLPWAAASLVEVRLMVIRRLLAFARPPLFLSRILAYSFELGIHTRLVVFYEQVADTSRPLRTSSLVEPAGLHPLARLPELTAVHRLAAVEGRWWDGLLAEILLICTRAATSDGAEHRREMSTAE